MHIIKTGTKVVAMEMVTVMGEGIIMFQRLMEDLSPLLSLQSYFLR
jgi:hypothetical protein